MGDLGTLPIATPQHVVGITQRWMASSVQPDPAHSTSDGDDTSGRVISDRPGHLPPPYIKGENSLTVLEQHHYPCYHPYQQLVEAIESAQRRDLLLVGTASIAAEDTSFPCSSSC